MRRSPCRITAAGEEGFDRSLNDSKTPSARSTTKSVNVPPESIPMRMGNIMTLHPTNQVKLLFIGDIFGHAGRRIVADHLDDIRTSNGIDVVIANGENSAAGFGITPGVADDLFGYGVDVMTSGNHIWDKKDIFGYIGRQPRLLRPANYPPGAPGEGVYI